VSHMVTYKNIRVKMKGGKSRLQRVKVLANGQYRFVKNTGGAKGSKRKTSPKTTRRTKTMAKKNYKARAKKVLGNYGASGLLEDAAIGFFGTSLIMGMGYPMESAMPMARLAQGAAGVALNRRGKGRLPYAVIDLIDVYLLKKGISIGQGVAQGISLEA